MISLLKLDPKVRQWLYAVAAFASALIPLLVTYNVISAESSNSWLQLIGILGGVGAAGATTAAVVTSKQRKEGTLDFTGSADEQAVQAIEYTAHAASEGVARLQKIIQAASSAVPPNPVSPNSDPSSANYQP